MKTIGNCVICGTELVDWNEEVGYCDECQAPVGMVAWNKFNKGIEHAQ